MRAGGAGAGPQQSNPLWSDTPLTHGRVACRAHQGLALQDHEDPNGWHICTAEGHWPDENFKRSGWWPIDGHHNALEEAGVPVSRWNLLYPLLPYDV